ncbi:FtsX-like permease family protein [Crateriforma conspicua]|uniref:FtsX-like permease family protein n=1 Tax=Crateriforma conspicua TaxID=2527996 RepID=UPI00118A903E|nr:FtsX-like permease family protein [Crateriforma conspicua]QDV61795.1 FtsX-like permease family protein [Crateriforma conspicua]
MNTTALVPSGKTGLGVWHMRLASLWYRGRVSIALALGVAIATAVIVGALLVGDSMRGSLRALTLQRLGSIDTIVSPGHFFTADEVVDSPIGAQAVFLFPAGVAESQPSDDGPTRRSGSVQILGITPSFWQLGEPSDAPETNPDDQSVVLNRACADELGVGVGDQITIRLPIESAVPADSPLGRRESETEGLPRMTVAAIVDNRGLGRFSLSASQTTPLCAYLKRELIADVLDRRGAANLLLSPQPLTRDDLSLDLGDLGLKLSRVTAIRPQNADPDAEPAFQYDSLTSEQLLIDDVIVNAVTDAIPGAATPVMTYLANAIEKLDDAGNVVASVPYSIITAIDSTDSLPLDYKNETGTTASGPENSDTTTDSRPSPIVINDWAADRLNAKVGDRLRIAYYEPEVDRGREVERYFPAVVTQIVPITRPSRPYRRNRDAAYDEPPTVYNDPDLTPTVPGVTDQESISDWDLPFELERKIEPEDDTYWNEHRLTPKAFIPLNVGRRYFASRFGKTTSLRIATAPPLSEPELKSRIDAAVLKVADRVGWRPIPIRSEQLSASHGTTPFDALFLSLSFFVIAAALMLIAMLFRLGLGERLKELGTLLAVGWQQPQVSRLILGEGLLVAAMGVLIGIAGGFAYAWLVLWGLRTAWVGAVTVPFLHFDWTPTSLALGGISGFAVSAATLWLSVRSLSRIPATDLLRGRDQASDLLHADASSSTRRWIRYLVIGCVLAAIAASIGGLTAGGTAAAGGFVGAGMLLLLAALAAVYSHFRFSSAGENSSAAAGITPGPGGLTALATRSVGRNPLRSTLTIGLMATATFLIIAMSAFQLRPTDEGTGGFDLIGTSAQPLYRDINLVEVRQNWFGQDIDRLADVDIVAMRQRRGQDASCNNLYQATQPTILGLPEDFGTTVTAGTSESSGASTRFAWAGHDGVKDDASPWTLLNEAATGTEDDPIPVILDQGTAMWSLQMRGGVGEVRSFDYDNTDVHFRVVGLLSNSVLQGKLMIGEANFQRLFPDVSGYSSYLVRVPDGEDVAEVSAILENRLGDLGMDLSSTRSVLAGLLAVQNTYLSTFQSLGGLGLLLGTIGLAVAQLRSVLERRRELAVLGALGFPRGKLARLVMTETVTLLLIGLGCGGLCAALAVLPYGILSGLTPPIVGPIVIVIAILILGSLAGLMAVVRVIRMPLLDALRGS